MQRSTDQTEMQKKRSVLIKQLAMCQYALNLYSSSIYMHTMLDGFRSVEDCDKNITQLRDEYLETCDAIEEKVDCVLSKGTRFRMSRNVYRRVERKRKRAIDARIAADILLPGMNGWAGFVAEVWHTDLLFEPIANRKKGYLLLSVSVELCHGQADQAQIRMPVPQLMEQFFRNLIRFTCTVGRSVQHPLMGMLFHVIALSRN